VYIVYHTLCYTAIKNLMLWGFERGGDGGGRQGRCCPVSQYTTEVARVARTDQMFGFGFLSSVK
jgi:hypothetical protein